MRILYVHEQFGALGGAEANVQITAAELAGRGHTVGIMHGPRTGRNEANWERTFPERIAFSAASKVKVVESALKEFQPDIIYVHKMANLDVIEALLRAGLPLVRMVHDHDIYCMRSYKYNYFTRRICTRAASPYCVFPCLAFVAKGAETGRPLRFVSYSEKKREIALNQRFNRMVVVSQFMKEELLRNGFEEDKIEIHPPVPRMAESSLRSSFSERNLILYVGQIIRGKGVDVLIESLANIQAPFECLILGEGNHRGYCESLTKQLGLSDRVKFKGFVPQDELKSYYGECTAVALSSVWPEPIATVGLEVLRYGLPVVAFDVGGVREWLVDGSNGFLVPWMDRRQYARRLEALLLDKALAKRMGEQGLNLMNERFDFSKYIAGLERMFEQVCAGRRRPGQDRCATPANHVPVEPVLKAAHAASACLR